MSFDELMKASGLTAHDRVVTSKIDGICRGRTCRIKRSARLDREARRLNTSMSRTKRTGIGFYAAGLGIRLRELRWKNSAWLATAETIAGWNGFEIRKAGSGRSPVRKRSG